MKCYDYAIKCLYNHPKTEQEIRIKLFQKWYSSEDVYSTIETLKKQKLINDKNYAQMYINSEVIKKGKPLLLIIKKLEFKGIPKNIIQEIINKYQKDIKEWIHQKIKKEIKNYKNKWEEGFNIIQKLLRKGYKLDDIKSVIKKNNTY